MSTPRKWMVIVAGLMLISVTWGAGLTGFALWAAPWIKTFGAPHAEIMAASMVLQLGLGLFSPLAGRLVERASLQLLMVAGLLITAGTFCLIALAQTMWQVTVLHAFFLSAGLVLAGPLIGHVLAVRLFQPNPGFAIGIINLGYAVGGFIMPLVIAGALEHYDWRAACFLVAAIIAGSTVPILLLAGRNLPRAAPRTISTAISAQAHRPMTSILSDRVFVGVLLCVVSLNLIFNATFFNLGPLLVDLNIELGAAAQILAASAIVGALGVTGYGALVDRVDYRLLIFLSFAVIGGGAGAMALGASLSVLYAAIPLMGGAAGGLTSVVPAVLSRHFGPVDFARANSVALAFSYIGSVGSLLAGLGRDAFGNYPAAFGAVLSVLTLTVLGLILLSGRPVQPLLVKP